MWYYKIEWIDSDGDTMLEELSDPIYFTQHDAETAGRAVAEPKRKGYHGVTPFVNGWPA